MKRILKALSAFSLSLVLFLSLAVLPVRAAETDPDDGLDSDFAGYIVILTEPAAPFSLDPLASATLMAAHDERDELLALSPEWSIYKAGSMDDIRSLVYAGQVSLVEPDYRAELFDVTPVDPDDPYLVQNKQSSLTGANGVQVRSAWEAGLTGEGVTVAVIDSGLNDEHEDAPLKVGRGRYFYYREEENGRYELEINGVKKRYGYYSSGNWLDNVGHGSMVCGVIAAQTDNGRGVASIAPGATILPIRCFTATPGHVGGYVSNLISGLNFAVENGADIINMSWGVTQESASLKTAVDAAYQAGCILIAAAGNDGGAGIPRYPAAWDNVISVGATDASGNLTYYSQRVTTVDVCAPGGSGGSPIVSLDYASNTRYASKVGTSFSSPMVAAAAALLLEADPTMTQGDFLALLKATSHPVTMDDAGLTSAARFSGCGRMDIQALLDETGYAGCSARRTETGFEVYAGYHPRTDSGLTDLIVIVGGYNAQGHLVESHTAALAKTDYNNCARAFPFTDPTIAEFRTFYLDSATFSALSQPIIPLLSSQNA